MAFRPKRSGQSKANQTLTSGSPGAPKVQVQATAVRGAERGANLGIAPEPSMQDKLHGLSNDEVRAAYKAVKGRDLTDRQIRRYRASGRIPDPNVEKLVRRRWEVKQMGGTDAAAAKFGRSRRTINDWQRNPGRSLKADAESARAAERRDRIKKASGIDPSRPPKIKFTADTDVRSSVPDSPTDYRTKKTFEFGIGKERTEEMSPDTVDALADAAIDRDHAGIVSILEQHATKGFAQFPRFNDNDGFHFDKIFPGLTFDWHDDDDK